MSEHADYFADKMAKMSEEKKLTRRKKKQHHGASSLLRATIQEYGIYDKAVDAYKTQFIQLFDFLESWKRPNSAGDNNNSINPERLSKDNQNNGKGSLDPTVGGGGGQRVNGNNVHLLQLDALPVKPYGRSLSLEEELEFRLQRMTSIANDLKVSFNKEKERRTMLLNEVTDCKEHCVQVVNDMTSHFHRETELLQHRLLEMDGTIDELEHEKASMKVAYEEMVNHANKTVEAMGTDLLKAEGKAKLLEEDVRTLRVAYISIDEENRGYREESKQLNEKMNDMKLKVETLENQLHASELSKEHYESLLDISLDKLRLLEYGEVMPRKNLLKLRQKRAQLLQSASKNKQSVYSGPTLAPPVAYPRRSNSVESTDGKPHAQEVPTTPKPRLSTSDSHSVTSYETGSEASGGALDTSRMTSDDRCSTTSSVSRTSAATLGAAPPTIVAGLPSPKTASRKKTKKKTFFAKAFQRKNQGATENNLAIAGYCEGLPTIKDECRGSQTSLTGIHDGEHTGFVKSFDASLLSTQNEYSVDTQESLLQRGRCHSVDDLDSYAFLNQECSHVEETTKRTKKVQRTTSFAAIRKNGLTAFAKEVEKRFRKKRRAKTADCTEILQAKEEFERSGKPISGSKES